MLWKRASSTVEQLPEQRKALAERYTIDADEAQKREQLAAEEAARGAADQEAAGLVDEEATRRAADAEAARRAAADAAARRTAREDDARAAPAPAAEVQVGGPAVVPDADDDAQPDSERPSELPIYRWIDTA